MQRITIDMITNKEFKKANRNGYDPQDVDVFLDAICDEMARLNDTIADLELKVQQLNATKPEPAHTVEVRTAPASDAASIASMQEVLTTAVRFKEQIIQEAKTQAKEIVENAEQQANDRLETLNREHDRLSAQVDSLRRAAAEYREKFEALIQAQKAAMDKADELF